MDRGACWVTAQGGCKELDATEQLSTHVCTLVWGTGSDGSTGSATSVSLCVSSVSRVMRNFPTL